METGYVKIWRKLEDSGLLQMPNTLALFMYILMNAAHKQRKVGTPTGVIVLERGQLIGGRLLLADRLEQSVQQIRTSLSRLQELDILTITSTSHFSIYTIENYSKYQDKEIVSTNTQPANNQPRNQPTTTKQELDLKNIPSAKKTMIPEDFKISDRVLNWANEKGHLNLEPHFEYFFNYAKSSGRKYVDWDRAFMNCIAGNWAKIQQAHQRKLSI